MKKQNMIKSVVLWVLLTISQQASAISVSQTINFPSIEGFGVFSTDTLTLAGWSSLFPFSQASEITQVDFLFSTTDTYFNSGIGPQNGSTGLEIGILLDDTSAGARKPLSSVINTAPNASYTQVVDPAFRFDAITNEVFDGQMRVSIGAFEIVNSFSTAYTISSPSSLTVIVTGNLNSEVPLPGAVWFFVSGLLGLVGIARRKKA